ncbi:hypothetical protein HaLaN_08144 [Haematococcus lacustris]|uniref:Uncharacterized protein n=1 Tax=Haematococcus lacustris TaxID=44745 RepID=A0A699YRH7_HAELA|nr:hypothetical protein HaLaN_08144 [Haematococcus lacustris]
MANLQAPAACSFLERRLQSRIDREEKKKVLLEAELSDDASDAEDVDLSSLQDVEKDSAEKDPPPQHINCHVLQPAQEDHDGVTSELGVLQWHEEDGPDAITAPEPAYQQLLQLGLVLEHQGARKEVLKLLFFPVGGGPLLLELSQALSALVAAWGAEGRAAAGRDPEGVAWRAAAAAAAVTVSRAGPSYQAGLRIIQALPPTSPQLVQLKQECALSLLQQLCRQVRATPASLHVMLFIST